MARNHVIHGFKFNGVDLKAARFSIDEADEFAPLVLPHSAKASFPLGDQTLTKAEFTPDRFVLALFEKHRLVFGFPRLGEGWKKG